MGKGIGIQGHLKGKEMSDERKYIQSKSIYIEHFQLQWYMVYTLGHVLELCVCVAVCVHV